MQPLEITIIGKPEQWLIEAAATVGMDISDLTHEITNYFVNHSLKRHGNAETEKTQGQVAVTPADFDRIPEIVKNPDITILNIKHNQEILIAYCKKFEDGTALYYEEVLNSRKNKVLRSKTIFKKIETVKKDVFLKIVSANTHIDITEIKIVVGAGGNPDGEAEA